MRNGGNGPSLNSVVRPHQMSLSNSLPGTWLLESRIDVTLAGERHPDPLLGEDRSRC